MQAQDQYQCPYFAKRRRLFIALGWIVMTANRLSFLRGEELPSVELRDKMTNQLIEAAKTQGDAERGLRVFTSAKAACFSCHKIGNAGSDIGPPLTEISKTKTPQEIAESLFWPNAKIAPDYLPIRVLLEDGTTVSGYVVEKESTDSELALKDPASGAMRKINRDSIESQAKSLSLMPNNLFDALPSDKQADLMRFLMDLGTNPNMDRALVEAAVKSAHHHEAATFPYERKPIYPDSRPHHTMAVNRDRVYDFYSKQARYFRQQPENIGLLQEFPGLDGPNHGHWGNQNEASWRGDEWNQAEPNLVQCNVLVHPKKTIPRAVCFRFGNDLNLSACYNSSTLEYEFFWRDGFLKFSPVRHGFIDGVRIAGTELERPSDTGPALSILKLPNEKARYRGYRIIDNLVIFEFAIGSTRYLDFLQINNGTIKRHIERFEDSHHKELLNTGKARWPQVLETEIRLGNSKGYTVDTIDIPFDNPWRATISIGDHGFLSDGTAIVATMQGDLFRVEGVSHIKGQELGKARWRRIAAGLHHALGVCVHNDQIYVLGRNQLTRLHDLNGDFETDWYECFSSAFETSPSGHDYICGLERDAQGNFYTASGNQGVVQISADGENAFVVANGFRNPDGIGLLPDGALTVPSSEGEWTAASMISLITPTIPGSRNPFYKTGPTPFYGYRGPKPGQTVELPLVYLPRGIDNSSGGQAWISDERMGPIQNQIVHTSFGSATAMLLLRDRVGTTNQGGVFVLPGEYNSGAHRAKINPKDGQLYISGMHGWGTYSLDVGSFQRLRYTHHPIQLPIGFHVHRNGVQVDFSEKLDSVVASQAKNHFAQCWNYRYSPGYGSKEYSVINPSTVGHDRLQITSSHVTNGEKSVFLEIPALQLCNQLHLEIMTASDEYVDLYLTVHAMDVAKSGFPNMISIAGKIELPHPLKRDLDWLQKSVPNPWRDPLPGSRTITIEARDNLQFSERQLYAKPGEVLKLVFKNPDVVPHNWALIKPGTLEKIGGLANALVNDPDAFFNQYVPRSDDVVCYTDVVEPKAEFSIHFKVPDQPGVYPYLCTFPGHWMVMNGELIVK